jgi:hypothetical protein
MSDVLLRAHLLDLGYSANDVERLRRQGELVRLRRGAYAWPGQDLDPEQQHRRLLAGTVPQLRAGATISHVSAAVLHGLPVWPDALARVHLTRPRAGGGTTRRLVEIHASELSQADITTLGALQVTSLARTVADLGRTLPLDQAVSAGDAARRHGLSVDALAAVLTRCRRWPGVGRARLMAELLDARSESAGESVSRVRMHEARLPRPEPQLEVFDTPGRLVGRADFGWRQQRVLGEFDGRIKYGRLLKPGQSAEEVVYREKLREDAFRDLDWRVVRWTWDDLYPGSAMVDRLGRALNR